MSKPFDAQLIADSISESDFSGYSATIIGYGYVGKEYFRALRRMGVTQIRACSRSAAPLGDLSGDGIETISGGYTQLKCTARKGELGIIGIATRSVIDAARHLIQNGFRRLLLEKPAALYSEDLESFSELCRFHDVDACVAYNRVAFPSVLELKARAFSEGGVTSCRYTFTEMIKDDWPQKFDAEDLARWGIANSLHVMSLAHGIIGLPSSSTFSAFSSGLDRLPWHSKGATFVGAGISDTGIPFCYHADWGTAGRWSAEFSTRIATYHLCPLEELSRKTSPLENLIKLPIAVFDSSLKPGFAEELAAMFLPELRKHIPLYTIAQAVALSKFGESVFNYSKGPR